MKLLSNALCALIALTILCSCTNKTARVNFTGTAPEIFEQDRHKQPLTMLACHNTSIPHNIDWGEQNPKTIPYGHQVKDGIEFFISKYYIASPPLPNTFKPKTPLILGVLSEDHFTLEKAGQNVDIFMDYTLLEPIQLGYLKVNYYSNSSDTPYCIEQNINKIPINIRCPEFKYTPYGKDKTGKSTGLGKGIGQMQRLQDNNGTLKAEGELFIPLDNKTQQALEGCTVEIMNDIILEHQIFFGSVENHYGKIDLTQAYKTYKQTKEHVTLYCRARPENEPATGCNPVVSKQR